MTAAGPHGAVSPAFELALSVADEEPSRVEFTLTNMTDQPVTAWCAELRAASSDGPGDIRGFFMFEGWAAVAEALESGQSVSRGLDGLVAALRVADQAASERSSVPPAGGLLLYARDRILDNERRELRRALDGSLRLPADEFVSARLLEARRQLNGDPGASAAQAVRARGLQGE